MSNIVDFLERLGRDAHLRHAAPGEVEQALEQAQIDPAVQAAILADDRAALEALLGAQTNVCCLIRPGEEDDEEEEDDSDDEDEDEDEELKLQRSAVSRASATF